MFDLFEKISIINILGIQNWLMWTIRNANTNSRRNINMSGI